LRKSPAAGQLDPDGARVGARCGDERRRLDRRLSRSEIVAQQSVDEEVAAARTSEQCAAVHVIEEAEEIDRDQTPPAQHADQVDWRSHAPPP
jgi:hypothetical protein